VRWWTAHFVDYSSKVVPWCTNTKPLHFTSPGGVAAACFKVAQHSGRPSRGWLVVGNPQGLVRGPHNGAVEAGVRWRCIRSLPVHDKAQCIATHMVFGSTSSVAVPSGVCVCHRCVPVFEPVVWWSPRAVVAMWHSYVTCVTSRRCVPTLLRMGWPLGCTADSGGVQAADRPFSGALLRTTCRHFLGTVWVSLELPVSVLVGTC
jgi:hypothetical protein